MKNIIKQSWVSYVQRTVIVITLTLTFTSLLIMFVIQPVVAQVDSIKDQTIGIMSFANVNGTEASEWIGSGITETLMSDLNIRLGLTVVDLGALSQALGSDNVGDGSVINDVSALELSRAMEANWLITGSYELMDNELLITARLYVVDTGVILKAVRVNGVVNELFTLQDQVVALFETQLRSNDVPLSAIARNESVPPDLSQSSVVQPPDTESSIDPGLASVSVTTLPPGRLEGVVLRSNASPPPVPPEVVSRNAAGRPTVRAVRLASPLNIDGQLNETVYQTVPAISGFIQAEPLAGSPASDPTEAWLFFGPEHVYVSFKCWESQLDRLVANVTERDGNVVQGDFVAFALDTFYDRRTSVVFTIGAGGGLMDGQTTDESQYSGDWNPIWDVAVGRFDGGWIVEAAVPFTSLRYRSGREQVWGIQMRRDTQWRNEISFLSPIPNVLAMQGLMMTSFAGTLVGVEVPESSGGNLEIKPYAISELSSDWTTTPQLSNKHRGDIGVDIKYGITTNLTADLTVNTDFAQVEADTQQINLTRFSLFFPEKREFFLENQGLFTFGGAGTRVGGGTTFNVPILFYSRQIGISQGQIVPMEFGSRLTGRMGNLSLGVMHMQTGAAIGSETTGFSVVRIKQDILRRSSIGVLFARRSISVRDSMGSNEAYGIDGAFAFYDNLKINTYWAATRTPGMVEDAVSYRTELDYNGDRYGLQLERLVVGKDFNPEIGFLRRVAFERSFASARFSPRPQMITAIRKLSWQGQLDYITDRAGKLETREAGGAFGIEFESSDLFDVSYTNSYERLTQPFRISPEVIIPVGSYSFQDARVSFGMAQHRRFSGTLAVQYGSFFGGEKATVDFFSGRLELTPKFSVEPGVSFNVVELPESRFTTRLITTRTVYTITPLMFVSALVQYNSGMDAVSTNLRLRWEYQPGSELFIVYNEQRNTLVRSFPELEGRALIIKINRLFQF